MSHTLTEVDTFTASVTVPDGADSRDDAAGDVTTLAQALANRTKHLNEHAAKIDEVNTFVENQYFQGDGSFDGTVGAAALDVGNAIVQTALTVVGTVTIPTMLGNVAIAGDLSVGGNAAIPNVAGNVTVSGDLAATRLDAVGDIFAGDDLVATGEFQYASAKSRSTYLNMFRTEGQWAYSSAGAVRHMEAVNPGDAQVWPICLPHGATLTEARMLVDKAGGGSMTLRVYKKTANGAFSAAPSEAQLGLTDTETGSGVQTLAVTLSEVVNLTAAEYYAFVIAGDAGDVAYQIRVQWTEPGPGYLGG